MALIDMDWRPSGRMLRNFGLIGLAVFAVLAAIVYFKNTLMFWSVSDESVTTVLCVLGGLALCCGVFGLTAPRLLWPLYITMSVAFYPIGVVVSHVVMALMFYLVITPVGVVFKMIGRDAMNRTFNPSAASYWIKRRPPVSVKRYFRQF